MAQKLAQKRFPYLLCRPSGYYFRFVPPRRVLEAYPQLPSEIRRSLRTDSYAEALALASKALPTVTQIRRTKEPEKLAALCAVLEQLDFQADFRPPASAMPQLIASNASGPLLSEVWLKFRQWKKWSPRIAADNQRMFDNLLYFIGDIPVTAITKKHLRSALDRISQLPQRNKKQYKGVSLDKLVKAEIPADDRVSGKYVKDHLKLCQSLFSRYLVKEADILSKSPTAGLKWEYEDQRYACLGDGAVRDLLTNAQQKPEWFQWFLRIAVYSGARRSEIANLKVSDFKIDEDTNRLYFVITQGKTKAARRCVPVHTALSDAGLPSMLKNCNGLLFPRAAKNPNRVTDLFKSTTSAAANDVGERVSFHSMRHTFITKARSLGASDVLIQQVVGHEKRGAGITDRYTHTFPISATIRVVDSVSY